MTNTRSTMIYKICSALDWAQALSAGKYEGSADDRRDGYLHFSSARQLPDTASRHFSGEDDLVLIAVLTSSLGQALKWEESRGGDLFPHFYGVLDLEKVYTVQPIVLDSDGRHVFPEDLV